MSRSQLFYDIFESTMGRLYLVFSGRALCGVTFEKPSDIPYRKGGADERFIIDLERYFSGEDIIFKQEITFLAGTDFEKHVWAALKEIPYGETRSYKWVAEKIGKPAATRAVGRALSKNPLPIIVPCHRVIESDGSLGGFSSGKERKRRLLELEFYAKLNRDG